MDLLTRQQILAAPGPQTVDVEVPEWGGIVRVRGLTAGERDRYEGSLLTAGGVSLADVRAKLVAAAAVDEEGERLFSVADVQALSAKGAAVVDRLATVASRLSGLGSQDVEDLRKNWQAGPAAGSSSS